MLLDIKDWSYVIPDAVAKYRNIPILEEGKDFVGYICDEICSVMADFIRFKIEHNESLRGLFLDYNSSKRQMTIKYAATILGTVDIFAYPDKEDKEVVFELDLNIDATQYSIHTSLMSADIEKVVSSIFDNILVKHNNNISTIIISELADKLGTSKFSKSGNDTIRYTPEGDNHPAYDVLKIINANEKAVCFKYMGKEFTTRFDGGKYTLEGSIDTMYGMCTSKPVTLIDLIAAISDTLPYCFVVHKDNNGLPVIQRKNGEVIAKIENNELVLLGQYLDLFADNTIKILKLISKITIK